MKKYSSEMFDLNLKDYFYITRRKPEETSFYEIEDDLGTDSDICEELWDYIGTYAGAFEEEIRKIRLTYEDLLISRVYYYDAVLCDMKIDIFGAVYDRFARHIKPLDVPNIYTDVFDWFDDYYQILCSSDAMKERYPFIGLKRDNACVFLNMEIEKARDQQNAELEVSLITCRDRIEQCKDRWNRHELYELMYDKVKKALTTPRYSVDDLKSGEEIKVVVGYKNHKYISIVKWSMLNPIEQSEQDEYKIVEYLCNAAASHIKMISE